MTARRTELRVVRASQIKPRPVRWFWLHRIVAGTIALVAGREGIGKSILVYTLIANITRGELPGEYLGEPRAVIVVATEDSWEHTIVPRLMAAGADLDLVMQVSPEANGTVSLPKHLAELESVANEHRVVALVLDPMISRLAANLDTHKDGDVRRALEPLAAWADRTGVAVIGLIHVNKSASTDPLTTVMGSRAFAAVARAVLFAMVDPDNENRRLLGQPKNNLGRVDLPTLVFAIRGVKVAETPEGDVWTGQLQWEAEDTRSIRDCVETAAMVSGDRTATAEASDWLLDYLTAQGSRADAAEVKRAGHQAGHSKDALQRARKRLGVGSVHSGFPRRAFWFLSSITSTTTTAPTTPNAPTEPVDAVSAVNGGRGHRVHV